MRVFVLIFLVTKLELKEPSNETSSVAAPAAAIALLLFAAAKLTLFVSNRLSRFLLRFYWKLLARVRVRDAVLLLLPLVAATAWPVSPVLIVVFVLLVRLKLVLAA